MTWSSPHLPILVGWLKPGMGVKKGDPIFPRIEIDAVNEVEDVAPDNRQKAGGEESMEKVASSDKPWCPSMILQS